LPAEHVEDRLGRFLVPQGRLDNLGNTLAHLELHVSHLGRLARRPKVVGRGLDVQGRTSKLKSLAGFAGHLPRRVIFDLGILRQLANLCLQRKNALLAAGDLLIGLLDLRAECLVRLADLQELLLQLLDDGRLLVTKSSFSLAGKTHGLVFLIIIKIW
jgi:hypothetical protein